MASLLRREVCDRRSRTVIDAVSALPKRPIQALDSSPLALLELGVVGAKALCVRRYAPNTMLRPYTAKSAWHNRKTNKPNLTFPQDSHSPPFAPFTAQVTRVSNN